MCAHQFGGARYNFCTYRAANKIKIEDSCIYFWAYIDKDEILFGDNRSKNMKRLYIHIH